MKFVINADTDEILGAPLLRIGAQEIINTVRCRRAARRHEAALCDAMRSTPTPALPKRSTAFDEALVTLVPADEPQVGPPRPPERIPRP